MNLFQSGHFKLHSGSVSRWKIECEALTKADWETLALMAVERLPPFSEVEGVPRGGIPFADALRKHCTPGADMLLIADDVCTTGNSMVKHRAGRPAAGVCAFARGEWPAWVIPIIIIPDICIAPNHPM